MARLARVVAARLPHHVTQRGNRRQKVFFGDDDYALYRDLLAEGCRAAGVAVWAYCLMPNHVHLILVPRDADGLRRALAPVHRYYAGHVHARQQRSGHFWQGRFGCVAMDEEHLGAALRYVALNPVRARLCKRAVDWPWSSVHAHLGRKDGLTEREPVLSRYPNFKALIELGEDEDVSEKLRQAETIGRPLGSEAFITRLERKTGRTLRPAKRGRKPKPEEDDED